MKYLFVIILVINPFTDLDKIARVNEAKKEAEQAYLSKNYAKAKEKYIYLKDSLGVNDDKLLLNLANSEYLLNDTTNAYDAYNGLIDSNNSHIRSIAYQQLGAIQFQQKKYKEALQHYKSSLKSDPGNADARYNYELLKKIIKEQEQKQNKDQQNKDQQNKDQQNKDQQNKDQQNKDQQNKDQQNKDQQNKDQQSKDQQNKDQQNKDQQNKDQQNKDQEQKNKEEQDQQKQDQQKQDEEKKGQEKEQDQQKQDQQQQEKDKQAKPNPIDEEKLKEMKISEEKARLILEAMKNNEVQYIQQNKRKAKKKKDPSKPDW